MPQATLAAIRAESIVKQTRRLDDFGAAAVDLGVNEPVGTAIDEWRRKVVLAGGAVSKRVAASSLIS